MLEELKKRFINSYPKLVALNPDIDINEIESTWDSDTNKTIDYNPPKTIIKVKHKFIFDNRLIPETFENIEVVNETFGKYPKEFPSTNDALPLEEWYSCENYINFVNNNLELIRGELLNPGMTQKEALDALTGDFEKHKKWCIELKNNRINNNKDKI